MDVYIVKIKACTAGKPVPLLVSCLCEFCSCSYWSEWAQTQQCLLQSIRLTDLSTPVCTLDNVLTAIIKFVQVWTGYPFTPVNSAVSLNVFYLCIHVTYHLLFYLISSQPHHSMLHIVGQDSRTLAQLILPFHLSVFAILAVALPCVLHCQQCSC